MGELVEHIHKIMLIIMHISVHVHVNQKSVYMICYSLIESFRRSASVCDCPTPCVQDTYVPTTSFAVVLGTDTGGQDREAAALEEKLHTARETDVRWGRTGRHEVFHLVTFHIELQLTFFTSPLR